VKEKMKRKLTEVYIFMVETTVLNKNAKTVKVKQGKNPRRLYPHQVEAITQLNLL
jgi:hypothetical protein